MPNYVDRMTVGETTYMLQDSALFPYFDASTAYNVGDYVRYVDGYLYRFTSYHAAGAWTGTDVAQIDLAEMLQSAVSCYSFSFDDPPTFNTILSHYVAGEVVVGAINGFSFLCVRGPLTNANTADHKLYFVATTPVDGIETIMTITIDTDDTLGMTEFVPAPSDHNHDTLYYTQSVADSRFAPISHTHGFDEIIEDPSDPGSDTLEDVISEKQDIIELYSTSGHPAPVSALTNKVYLGSVPVATAEASLNVGDIYIYVADE